jgi:hypothetical protein
MLKEFHGVRQEPNGRRRWFDGDGLDLMTWYDAQGRLTGFQLGYDFGAGAHALTWGNAGGFAHSLVDEGDSSPLKNESPVLVADGAVPWAELEAKFAVEGAGLEPGLRELVTARLAARA